MSTSMKGVYRIHGDGAPILLAILPTRNAAETYIMEWVPTWHSLKGMLKQASERQITYDIKDVIVTIHNDD